MTGERSEDGNDVPAALSNEPDWRTRMVSVPGTGPVVAPDESVIVMTSDDVDVHTPVYVVPMGSGKKKSESMSLVVVTAGWFVAMSNTTVIVSPLEMTLSPSSGSSTVTETNVGAQVVVHATQTDGLKFGQSSDW